MFTESLTELDTHRIGLPVSSDRGTAKRKELGESSFGCSKTFLRAQRTLHGDAVKKSREGWVSDHHQIDESYFEGPFLHFVTCSYLKCCIDNFLGCRAIRVYKLLYHFKFRVVPIASCKQ